MKEIGEKLKNTREEIGISIDEAAEDLKLRPSQIENIESGNLEAFKDVFYLKYFIRDYSKYLGLDYEKMVDEFNEYLFDYTSKISIEDIKKAKKTVKPVEPIKKISSPYTLDYKKRKSFPTFILYAIIVVLVAAIVYLVFSLFDEDEFKNERGGNYEFTEQINNI